MTSKITTKALTQQVKSSSVASPAGTTKVQRLVRSFCVMSAMAMAPIRWRNDLKRGDRLASVMRVTKKESTAV